MEWVDDDPKLKTTECEHEKLNRRNEWDEMKKRTQVKRKGIDQCNG